jgi:hypothetical protein
MAAQLDTPTGTIERPLGEFSPDIMTRLHSKGLDWQRLTGSPRFDYLIALPSNTAKTETGAPVWLRQLWQ